jgi:hypothetical protein
MAMQCHYNVFTAFGAFCQGADFWARLSTICSEPAFGVWARLLDIGYRFSAQNLVKLQRNGPFANLPDARLF